ncbi:hypothetical protein [Asticcacaulis sp. AC402]|uniref:hypothetical protein n=1 Tax=Asticcacaulis sp. AC402 TaxID=1282361 RepID=UPI0012DF8B72|nr:hypothetical protein [Asticcacaulis sp. AC402]
MAGITERLEHAVKGLRNPSPDMQDSLARMVLQVVGEEQPAIQLSAEEEASFGRQFRGRLINYEFPFWRFYAIAASGTSDMTAIAA